MKHFLFLHEFYTSCAMIKLIIYQSQNLIVQTQKIFWPFDSDMIKL